MRMIDGEELYQIESLLKTDIVERSKTANWLMGQVLHDIEASPTIDPESLPVVKELRAENEKLNRGIESISKSVEIAFKQRDELRKELEKVKAERDVLFKLLQSTGITTGIAERLKKALDMTEKGLFGGPATME